jgi:phosphoribosylformylglycinamidine cyclo-ligase
MAKLSYRDAGLDLDLYEKGLAQIAPLVKRTHSPRVLDGFGGFASLYSIDFGSRLFAKNYRKPVLLSSTDGVGTKLKVAALAGWHDTVGIDLVAMSVNDCLCAGGEPLFFLDYVAMAKDDPPLLKQIVQGISDGCLEADCSLVGGETAILPDVYKPGDYDLAGFCVAIAERHRLITGRDIEPGDAVIGLASTGFHSNGYSLVRKVVFDHAKLKIDQRVSELDTTVGEALLRPTRIYVRPVLQVLRHYERKHVVHGMAHITGGGLVDNIPRILPKKCQVVLRRKSWPVPPLFTWLKALGDIDQAEMDRVFNQGIGYVMIVAPYYADSVRQQLRRRKVQSWIIGEVIKGEAGLVWT